MAEIAEWAFEGPIARWDEALPLGNGLFGCLVWGDGAPLRFSLDRGDLWDNRQDEDTKSPDYTYANLIELVGAKEWTKIYERYEACYDRPSPTKIPPGRIELSFGELPERIEFTLSVRRAEAVAKLVFRESSAVVRSFLHAGRRIGFIRVESGGRAPSAAIVPPAYVKTERNDVPADRPNIVEANELSSLGFPAPELSRTANGRHSYRQRTCEEPEFAVLMVERSGAAGVTEFAYTIATNTTNTTNTTNASSGAGEDWLDEAEAELLRALEEGYDRAFAAHSEWWDKFHGRSSISLPEPGMERMWVYTNYLLGSCSRKGAPPMPLQGVWTADGGLLPPWKGDYHHNLNTQLSYWHYLKANRLEEGEAFLDFLWRLVPEAEAFAREFFDAPGLCLPPMMTLDGKPVGGWVMYFVQLTNQIWLCQAFDHYWQYTGDKGFLRDRAYPYFRETARCMLRWLEPGPDGKLLLPLSASPEIHDNRPQAWVTPNSNYDLSLLIYLFRTLAEMADELGMDDNAAEWRACGAQLPELAVNAERVLMISPDESLQESHRHLAHMMPVYPLNLLDYDGNPEHKAIIDASVRDLEILGKGLWVGFTYGWMANLYAVQGNGEAAWYHLKLFRENFVSPNGFHLNGDHRSRGISVYHYRPFTLEGNMAIVDALQEMLLKNDRGLIRLFPAVPEAWRRQGVSFERLRSWRGVLVSAETKGKTTWAALEAEREVTLRVRNDFGGERLKAESGGGARFIDCRQGEAFELRLAAGERCTLSVWPQRDGDVKSDAAN